MIKKWIRPTSLTRALFFILADSIIFFVTFFMAYQLRFNFHVPEPYMQSFKTLVIPLILIKITILYLMKFYFISWRFFVLRDALKLFRALFISYLIFWFYLILFYHGPFPRSTIFIDFLLSLFLVGSLRFSKRIFQDISRSENIHPALLIGGNQKALQVISACDSREFEFYPVAIVDDDPRVLGSYLGNIKVNHIEKLEKIVQEKEIDSAIITRQYTPDELDSLFERLKRAGVSRIKHFKLLGDKNEKLFNLSIEDLLARKPKDLDTEAIRNFIKDKSVMITGAGGSIGSEIARQCAKYGAGKLILLDHSEYNLYKITEELADVPHISLMQSVVDKKLLRKSFENYRPQIVIHAAAYKHVPLCEENIEGAVLNNIVGTKNTIDLSIEYGVEKFVLISTDKAVRPTNVMGATKRVCELYAQNVAAEKTLITAVRFGNVLGSSGSVIPKFRYQIEHNRPLTVTHPEVTRYFMLIPEACQLVLQAASLAKKRELFILDMGKPVKIADLAQKMLKLYGKEHLGIVYTGLRPGEKLYEELLISDDDQKTRYDSIMVTEATAYDMDRLNSQIEKLIYAEDKVAILKEIIPEFEHK